MCTEGEGIVCPKEKLQSSHPSGPQCLRPKSGTPLFHRVRASHRAPPPSLADRLGLGGAVDKEMGQGQLVVTGQCAKAESRGDFLIMLAQGDQKSLFSETR